MEARAVGGQWLKERFNMVDFTMTHASYIASYKSLRLTSRGNIEEYFGPKYAPHNENAPLDQVAFYLKYDDFNLDFLQTVFNQLPEQEVLAYIEAAPGGRQARKIGFLYEWLTGKKLQCSKPVGGNYVDLLDSQKYITGGITKDPRWRINNNLLGTQKYCPVVRITPELQELLRHNMGEKIKELKEGFPEDIFVRATNFLFTKETRSSYEIEKETPSPDRMQKFVFLLQQAGSEVEGGALDKKRLVLLQNAIVDPRFAATTFRDFQNYVGQSMGNGHDYIHYVCPPPSMVLSLMEGMQEMALKSASIYPEIMSGIISFGFVFIHPFEDGNGRIHRFLIHDVLTSAKVVPEGLIIPVSAHMLQYRKAYDNILEQYSKPLMQRVKTSISGTGEITITNEESIAGYFRYPDLTNQCIYLLHTIHDTIQYEMPGELAFILKYDEAKRAVQQIVDMPDRMISRMLTFLHQNKGVLSRNKRNHFPQLTDGEIEQMQQAYHAVFLANEK